MTAIESFTLTYIAVMLTFCFYQLREIARAVNEERK